MMAVAAIREHLKELRMPRKFAIILESYAISGPHLAAAPLTEGAGAVYARGAYELIKEEHHDNPELQIKSCQNYQAGQASSLAKIMSKVGIPDTANYINGRYLSAYGLDLTPDAEDKSSLL